MGNCLFIPSEGKIEYRNPCLLPGVGFTEALAASFTHSIPPALALEEVKKCYSRNPADSCLSNTQPYESTHTYTHTEESAAHSHMLSTYRPGGWQELDDLLTSSDGGDGGQRKEYSQHRKWNLPSSINIIAAATTQKANIPLWRVVWAHTESGTGSPMVFFLLLLRQFFIKEGND